MAVQTAIKFLELLEHHSPTRTQYAVSNPETLEEITRWAMGKGFIFTPDDLEQAMETRKSNMPIRK